MDSDPEANPNGSEWSDLMANTPNISLGGVPNMVQLVLNGPLNVNTANYLPAVPPGMMRIVECAVCTGVNGLIVSPVWAPQGVGQAFFGPQVSLQSSGPVNLLPLGPQYTFRENDLFGLWLNIALGAGQQIVATFKTRDVTA